RGGLLFRRHPGEQAGAGKPGTARTSLAGRWPGELPDRVVALELRRPVLGAGDPRSSRAVWPGRRRSGRLMSVATAPAATAPSHCPQGAVLTVDLHAVAANTRFFAARTRAEVMAVVKADGFGPGWP